MTYEDTCKALADAQIGFSVHYSGTDHSPFVVFTVKENLTNDQVKVLADLGANMDALQGTFMILTKREGQA